MEISIVKSFNDSDPQFAKDFLAAVSEKEAKKVIQEKADFSGSFLSFVEKLSEKGYPISSCNQRTDRSIGEVKYAFVTICEFCGGAEHFSIVANCHLLKFDIEKDWKIIAQLFSFNLNTPEYDYETGCPYCHGWGCWSCNYSGGF